MVMNDMTDDGKWGAAIPIVDGKRPEWLEDDDVCALVLDGNLLDGDGKMTAADWVWGGTHQFIRLPASHPHYQQPQTLTAQEHLARMEALVRKIATYTSREHHTSELLIAASEARALVAEMEPVDPDEAEAVDLLAHSFVPQDEEARKLVIKAIKRGRELARGEGR